MINFGLGTASILGIFLAVAGAGLYFLRNVRPELARDHDIFFAAVGLLCGFILLFQGWRLDPILQFGQLLLTGSAIFFAVESIRLRGVATEQAKRSTRIVDEDRPVSQVYEYEAELDDYEPLEEERPAPRRQIRGSRDTRPTRMDEYEDEAPRRYRRDEEESPRRLSNRSSNTDRLGQGDKPRQRRPRTDRPAARPQEDEWNYPPTQATENWDTPPSRTSRSSRPSSNGSSRAPENLEREAPSRPRKRRPPQNSVYSRGDDPAAPSDYVDYKPIEQPDDERDNSSNFDEP
jgi:hypothetical protein